MQIGKVPENVLKRSVLKQIVHRREEVILHAGIGEDCTALGLAPDEILVMSTDPITGTDKGAGSLAVHITANDLASSGAEPIGILASVILPPGTTEKELKQMMKEAAAACARLDMEILGGHTEISDAVNRAVITVTGVGRVKKGGLVTSRGMRPGDDIVMTKWAGTEGTGIIAAEKEEVLRETLPEDFIENAKAFSDYLSVVPESRIACRVGVSAMHDVTEGGVFGALWEIASASGVGIEVDLKKIPIRQETVEICERFDINPYMLISSGSMLIAAPKGNLMADELNKAGIAAAVIGRAVEGNDRVVVNGEERRFLEPAGSDELYKIYDV